MPPDKNKLTNQKAAATMKIPGLVNELYFENGSGQASGPPFPVKSVTIYPIAQTKVLRIILHFLFPYSLHLAFNTSASFMRKKTYLFITDGSPGYTLPVTD